MLKVKFEEIRNFSIKTTIFSSVFNIKVIFYITINNWFFIKWNIYLMKIQIIKNMTASIAQITWQ